MEVYTPDAEVERLELISRYKELRRAVEKITTDKEELHQIRKAFDLAVDAHKEMRRKSGEPYIYHPIAVAMIAVSEMGLDATSVVCALLHDVVEDTEITLEDITKHFGQTAGLIIDGLTKIAGVFDNTKSVQAENFRKIVLSLSDDIRVILIKLADRLHNMRTLEHMKREKQLKIASETMFMYAPLAHRLGLYSIKTELEDLCLKYIEPEAYEDIVAKLTKTKGVRERFISRFTLPIKNALNEQGYKYTIKGRPKSVYSIYQKIHQKGVPFEEIYDIFAIRIIVDVPLDVEKAEIWRAYSIVTDLYQPKPDRLRDWISFPRANGYESLHVTVMSPTGKWVEVQLRSTRMDDIAERGLAAHWKYKENNAVESAMDDWITKVRETMEAHQEGEAVDFIDAFKLNLYTDEIYVFTPKGELRTMAVGSTALDFAYEIHSDLGDHCLGAKVNTKLVPLSYILQSGDQLEIISSEKQSPKEDWLNFVKSSKARTRIKAALKEEKRKIAVDGREIFDRKIKKLKLNYVEEDLPKLLKYFNVGDSMDFFYRIGKGTISSQQLKTFYTEESKKSWYSYLAAKLKRKPKKDITEAKDNFESLIREYKREGELLIGDSKEKLDYKLAPCCNPIPGDEVFGFVTVSDGIKIHKITCPNAVQLLGNQSYRVVKAKWTGADDLAFLTGIKVNGIDEVGIVNKITKLISNQMKVNMRSIYFDSNDGVFEGRITLFVQDTRHLDELVQKLKKVEGIISVDRMNETQG
jgi:guanosine-3',5'-bis(diphosphate) 3'-pyrophosphohydrolase